MIKTKLPELMASRRQSDTNKPLKVVDVAEETGIHKNTLYRLYNGNSTRVDMDVLDRLCRFFECSICDLMEYEAD